MGRVSRQEHGHWQELLGAYALGHLPEDLSAGLEAHLDGCPQCRVELEGLAEVARALPLADPARVVGRAEEPAAEVEARTLARVAAERTAGRTRRAVWVVSAAAVLVVVAVLASSLLGGDGGTRVALAGGTAGVSAEALVEARPWGTRIELVVAGLPEDAAYRVWLERPDGERVPAGTFRGVRGRELTVVLASALPLGQAVAVGVSAEDGTTLLEGPIPAAA